MTEKLQLGEANYIAKYSTSPTAGILKPLLSFLRTMWRETKTLFYYSLFVFTLLFLCFWVDLK